VGIGFDSHNAEIANPGYPVNCNLTTSTINASFVSSLYLGYSDHCAAGQSSSYYCFPTIEVSNDGGTSWTSVFKTTWSHYPVKRNVVNITNLAAGYNNVKIRFHYIDNGYGSYWAIDSVVVADTILCNVPPDSGLANAAANFECTGGPVHLFLDNLSRGVGQTYQWWLKNAASGNAWTTIPGAIYDTSTAIQNSASYYMCNITCGGLSVNSRAIYITDTPKATVCQGGLAQLCSSQNDTIKFAPNPTTFGGPNFWGPHTGFGLHYQWQQSNQVFGTYSDIPVANDSEYVFPSTLYTNTTYFKCILACPVDSTIYLSLAAQQVINPTDLCYCIPNNNELCGVNSVQLTNVSILSTSLNNSSGCTDTFFSNTYFPYRYAYYPPTISNATATLQRGTTYVGQLTHGGQTQTAWMGFWIDYDHNGVFDSTEFINFTPTIPGAPPNVPYSMSFTVPFNAVPGQTGLRARSTDNMILLSTAACDPLAGGETEDYVITIDTTTGITNIEQGILNVELFPNPAKDELTVRSNASVPIAPDSYRVGIRSVEIENVVGEAVFNLRTPNSKLLTKIGVSNLAPGIYFVKVTTDRGSVVRKFIKQ
jgi:hypothetical protein